MCTAQTRIMLIAAQFSFAFDRAISISLIITEEFFHWMS